MSRFFNALNSVTHIIKLILSSLNAAVVAIRCLKTVHSLVRSDEVHKATKSICGAIVLGYPHFDVSTIKELINLTN